MDICDVTLIVRLVLILLRFNCSAQRAVIQLATFHVHLIFG